MEASVHKAKSYIPYLLVVFFNAFVDLGHKILLQNTLYQTVTATHYTISSSILNALILLPYILLFTPSGFISDKFAKATVMRLTALAAIPLTLLVTLCYYHGWFWAAFLLTIMLGMQSAINSPAKYGYIKEIFGKGEIASANAYVQAVAIVAILAGTFVFTLLFSLFVGNHAATGLTKATTLHAFAPLGFLLVFCATIEFLCTLALIKSKPADPDSNYSVKDYIKGRYLKSYMTTLTDNSTILICIIGLGVFWGVNQVLLASYGAYLKSYVMGAGPIFAQGSLAVGGIGILFGAIYAGRVSRGFVETGLIPIAAIGITIGLALVSTLVHKTAICILFLVYGFFGGMFIVPLNSLIQFHAKTHELGKVLAGNNFIQNIFMLGFLLLTTVGALLGMTAKLNFFVLFLIMLAASIATIILLPQSLIRYVVYIFISRVYKTTVSGLDNMPSSGGVLLLGNHTSFLDWAFIQIASPRPVRFVMERAIYEKWYLKWILKHLGLIPIARGASKDALAQIHSALKQGDVVALFPEGALSRNGQLGKFHTGFERAARESGCVIIPFFIRGLWGTKVSYANDHFQALSRKHHRSISLVFGSTMPDDATATAVKQAVTHLSVIAWRQFAEQLQPIPHEWIRRSKKMLSQTAIIDSLTGKMNYAKLMALVFHLTKKLSSSVNSQQCVGVLLPTSAAGIAANLSLWCLGKTVVNLNYTAGATNIQHAIADADISAIITSRTFIKRLRAKGFDLDDVLATCNVVYIEDQIKIHDKLQLLKLLVLIIVAPTWLLVWRYCQRQQADAVAAILFSSGSEGKPKGVMLTHRNIVSNIKQVADVFDIQATDTILSCLPLFHAFGLTATSLMPVIEGIPAVCHADPTDAKAIGRLVYKYQCSVMCSTSSILGLYSRNPKMLSQMLAPLRFVIAGAEKLSESVAQQFKKKFNVNVYEGYGATELSPVASTNLPDVLSAKDWHMHKGTEPGTVGLPLPGTAFSIVDPSSLAPLPIGEAGLILVSGPQLMKGYLNHSEKTQSVLCDIDGTTWYKTGDKGFLNAEGFLTIVDRYSRFAKIAGEMVSLVAVEQKILSLLAQPDADVLAVTIKDDKKGESICVLHNLIDTDLKLFLLNTDLEKIFLPSVCFYVEELPKLGSGKKDYSRAKSMVSAFLDDAS